MDSVAFIACSREKASQMTTAWKLYQSERFHLACRYARMKLRVEQLFVLSAKHGLICMGQELDPYDETLEGKTDEERGAWARRVMRDFTHFITTDQKLVVPKRIIVLARSLYADPLRPYLPTAEFPLIGTDRGQEIEFLRAA